MRKPALLLASSIALVHGLAAQGDFAFDKTSDAGLGSTLKLDYAGAPASKPMVFMLSTNGGPTPIKAMFGGNDPRSVLVGVDLLTLWVITGTTGTGNGTFNIPVPNDPSLQGANAHLQLMTGGGVTSLIDKISNKVVVIAGASGTADILKSQLGDGRPTPDGRALMSASPLANGEVLLAGGGSGNILGAYGVKTSEIFDSRTMSARPGPDMTTERALHTATVLKDGRVLIVGGVDAGTATTAGNAVASCEIYDPATNSFAATSPMSVARAGHGATLLNDGRVLVAAGTKELADVVQAINGILNTCEIWDPATGNWTPAAPIGTRVLGPALTTLKNGKVLVSGGAFVDYLFNTIPIAVKSTNSCQLYDPASGIWSNTGSMRNDRSVHTNNTILLNDGRVLVTGGVAVDFGLLPPPTTFAGAKSTAAAEYYDPATGSWTSLPDLAASRFAHTAHELPSGKVLVVGGAQGALDTSVSLTSIEEFDPTANTFPRQFDLRTARGTHGGQVLGDGTVAVFGGIGSAIATTTLRSIEVIHP